MTSSEPWADAAISPRSRVRVIKADDWDGPWAQEFIGVIDPAIPPRLIKNKNARPGELQYLVAFLESQRDANGDGPYDKAMIWARYLQVVED